ncbi:MAG: class I SAM-dependent methyltransferase [Gammaproteobacteria bacterium]|nr:class I SAM-dependent methyltransferase [Gammaproteobacteria bacterium]MCY4338974.1 class I SAM-dependent methyltransferase [Gammaproteobacteria bacterium]
MNAPVDFGFHKVAPAEKTRRVGEVFSSVAARYDLMNDLMSFGVHRLWKRLCVHLARVPSGSRVLDLAAGTGDLAARLQQSGYEVVACDINEAMLSAGRDKLADRGLVRDIHYVRADAERLPFAEHSFDCATLAFGLRNMTDKPAALRAIHAGLKYGGQVLILEFSRVSAALLRKAYDAYSFHAIPALGKLVLQDADSYRYLVESIRMHPDQDSLKTMLEQAGFARVDYLNLSGGIVALHRGYKL